MIKLPIYDYLIEHGRLPRMGEDPQPWAYRGWLLPYVIALHEHPYFGKENTPDDVPKEHVRVGNCPDRWGYYLNIRATEQLPDEPIPRVDFRPEHETVVRKWWESETKGIGQLLHIVENHVQSSAFRCIIDWIAYGLAIDDELARDLKEPQLIKLYQTFNVEPLLLEPSDYFGAFLAATKTNKFNTTGFYPTPHVVCEMMARMTIDAFQPEPDDTRDPRLYSVIDPCVGTGRMLLHASNHSLNLWGMDIDPLVIKIAKINGALYAPWLTWPLPSKVIGKDGGGLHVGNSLAKPFTEQGASAAEPEPAPTPKPSPGQGSLFD